MPNLIHSLDAASLSLLVEIFCNTQDKFINIFTVHDCFAVTANNIQNIMNILKQVYIIYSDDDYLINLDKGIKEFIKFHYGEECFEDDLSFK